MYVNIWTYLPVSSVLKSRGYLHVLHVSVRTPAVKVENFMPLPSFFMQMRPCPWSNAEDKQCVMDMQWWCIAGDWRWHKTTHADVLNSINSLVSCMYLKQQPGDDLWHLSSDQLSHLHSSCSYRLRAFSLILKQLFSTLLDLCYCFERERENQSLVLSMLKHDVSILDHFFFTLFTSVFNNYLVFIWMKELQNTFILAGGEVLRRLEGFFAEEMELYFKRDGAFSTEFPPPIKWSSSFEGRWFTAG